MLRRIASTFIQTRGIKHTVKVKWVKPEVLSPHLPERTGDLETLPPIPPTALGKYYALSEEIEEAPEAVKKIFSVAFLGQKHYNDLVREHFMGRVKRHKYDVSTAETRIARLTGYIRCLQKRMEIHPKDCQTKKTLLQIIDRRKKLLKFLRQYDYKKFEWLLEKLNIEYKAHPDSHHRLYRKEALRKLTEMHCEEVRNSKLAHYRTLLESQQGPFLKEKLEALKFIKSEQEELKVPITVTTKDIQKVEEQLKEWTLNDEIKQKNKKMKKKLIQVEEL